MSPGGMPCLDPRKIKVACTYVLAGGGRPGPCGPFLVQWFPVFVNVLGYGNQLAAGRCAANPVLGTTCVTADNCVAFVKALTEFSSDDIGMDLDAGVLVKMFCSKYMSTVSNFLYFLRH